METAVKPTERLEKMASMQDFGIYKSSRLPIHTMSVELLSLIRQRGTPCVQKMCDCYERSISPRAKVLEQHVITDIICLPDLEKVMQGVVEIPGTKMSPSDCLFYKPEEYRLHLEHILWYLETYPNYQVILLDEPLYENITAYVKGDSYADVYKRQVIYSLADWMNF